MSPRLGSALVAALAGVDGMLPYDEGALFDPRMVGGRAWPRQQTAREFEGLGGNWYNPGVALLSAESRRQLSAETDRDVTYLMSFRRNLNMGSCTSLVNPTRRSRPYKTGEMSREQFAEFGSGIVSDRMSGELVLADSRKTPLLPPLRATGDEEALRWFENTDDLRLEVAPRFERSKILAHGNTRESRDNWYNNMYAFFWIEILDKNTFRVSLFEHPQVKANPWKNRERIQNIGVLWDGSALDNFRLVWWLDSVVDVRVGIPPRPSEPPKNSTGLDNGLAGSYRKKLHGNGSPIALDDWYPGLAVAAAHFWLDATGNSEKRNRVYNSTRWHNTYLSHFVVFKNKPPYETVATSPAFCFPSLSPKSTDPDAPLCDIIQFVTGLVRVPDSTNALVTYGINDCEAAWIEIPIVDLIRHVSPDLALRLERRSVETSARHRAAGPASRYLYH
mmetsp:Transcript_17078/g.53335  ORF Transcript_17078/g.53335 Transcript_17078/m.53335 type:complete len:447 (+) Transcript_17078:248-1588(+)